jgi:hypothetical protein
VFSLYFPQKSDNEIFLKFGNFDGGIILFYFSCKLVSVETEKRKAINQRVSKINMFLKKDKISYPPCTSGSWSFYHWVCITKYSSGLTLIVEAAL